MLLSFFFSQFTFLVGQVRRVQVRGEWLSQCHTTDFVKFSELKYERKWVHISPYEFFFIISIYTWFMKEKKMCSFALIYIQGCKCRGGVKYLWECELMREPLTWVLFYITLIWNMYNMQRFRTLLSIKKSFLNLILKTCDQDGSVIASISEGWVFDSHPRQNCRLKTSEILVKFSLLNAR